jgi:O-antigen/teichoic acid export membrane protein
MSLFALLGKLGFDAPLIRFLPKAEKPVDMINSRLTLSGIVALVAVAIFLAGINIWSPALGFIRHDVVFSLAFVFFALCWALSVLLDSPFIAGRRAEFVLSKNTIIPLLKIPLPQGCKLKVLAGVTSPYTQTPTSSHLSKLAL